MTKFWRFLAVVVVLAFGAVACSSPAAKSGQTPGAGKAPAKPKLGIRPAGDTEIQPDMSKITTEDLKKVFAHIDEHLHDHIENLHNRNHQPSIPNSGEG